MSSGSVVDQVLQPGAVAGSLGQADHAARLGIEGLERSTAARSRLGSPYACWTWRPSQTVPSSRTRAGAAPGSSEQSCTVRSPSTQRAAAPSPPARTRAGRRGRPRRAAPRTAAPRRRAGRRRRCRGRPCSDDPSRTGRAGAGRRLRLAASAAGAASVRLRWRDFFPMQRTLGGVAVDRARPVRPGRAGRARWCGSGWSRPTSARPGSPRSRGRGRRGRRRPASTHLGSGQGAAVGDGDVEPGVARRPGDLHGAVGERTGVTDGVADQLADHQAGVVAGLVARHRGCASTPRAAWRATPALSAAERQVEATSGRSPMVSLVDPVMSSSEVVRVRARACYSAESMLPIAGSA